MSVLRVVCENIQPSVTPVCYWLKSTPQSQRKEVKKKVRSKQVGGLHTKLLALVHWFLDACIELHHKLRIQIQIYPCFEVQTQPNLNWVLAKMQLWVPKFLSHWHKVIFVFLRKRTVLPRGEETWTPCAGLSGLCRSVNLEESES